MTRPMPRLISAALLALALASPAQAATRNQIIKDCADDGQLQGHYSPSELRDARQHMPSDVAEYTDCADVLRRAELPPGGHSTSAGSAGNPAGSGAAAAAGGGGSRLLSPSTPADQAALTKAAQQGSQPVEVGGKSVVPGATGLQPEAARNGLPTTLLAALILLGAAAGALTLPSVRSQLPFFGRK